MAIQFVSLENVLTIHAHQINQYGGQHGLRDENLLASALGMPQMTFGGDFLHDSIAEMAAAYMYHLTMNHPFIDGNKRIGTATALVFIEANNHKFQATHEELTEFAWKLAAGEKEKKDVIEFIKNSIVKID